MSEQFASVPPPLTQTAVQDAIGRLPGEVVDQITSAHVEPADPLSGSLWRIVITPKGSHPTTWPNSFEGIPVRYNDDLEH